MTSVTTQTVNNIPAVKIASREFKANPYPFYARLRAEAPVYRTILPDKQPAWLITRYEDVLTVLKDETHFVKNRRTAMNKDQLARTPWMPPMFRAFESNILDKDGADHARLRGLIHKAFTPAIVEQMRTRIEVLANELIDKAVKKGKIDLIQDYALPIPLNIIAEVLGISPQDRDKFRTWSKSLISLGSTGNVLLVLPNMYAINRYLRRTIKERRAHPQNDLLTALVQAEESGEKLTEDELVAMIFVLLIAGHETTVNLIGSGMLALLENPKQLTLLNQKPSLIKIAIEELLRYASPLEQATERYAREDITMHGVTIPKSEMVLAVIASANRDEAQFQRADELDITRENNKHVAFGMGVHYCVGAPLARLEGQIAISTLVRRLPDLHLAVTPNQLRWRPGLTLRGLEALPVEL